VLKPAGCNCQAEGSALRFFHYPIDVVPVFLVGSAEVIAISVECREPINPMLGKPLCLGGVVEMQEAAENCIESFGLSVIEVELHVLFADAAE